jgi:hypothetical protein
VIEPVLFSGRTEAGFEEARRLLEQMFSSEK